MPIDQVVDLVPGGRRCGEVLDAERQLELDRLRVERLDLHRGRRREQDGIAAQEHGVHDVGNRRRRLCRRHADAQLHPVSAVGAAEIGELRLGQAAVGQHDEVVRGVEQMGRPPVGLHDPAFEAVAQHDPVADLVGLAEIEGYAGKDVAERALQGKAQDDGEYARGRDQRSHRCVEDVGHDRQRGAEVDDADDEILDQPALARPALEDQEHPGEARQHPGGIHPPDDLRQGDEDALEGGRGVGGDFVGNDVVVEQQGGQRQEEGELEDQAPGRIVAQQDARDQRARHGEHAGLHERIGRDLRQGQLTHCPLSL